MIMFYVFGFYRSLKAVRDLMGSKITIWAISKQLEDTTSSSLSSRNDQSSIGGVV